MMYDVTALKYGLIPQNTLNIPLKYPGGIMQ